MHLTHLQAPLTSGLPTSTNEVTDATVAAVAAAASAAAAAAAAAVVAAAGQQVQAHMQVHPPSGFPFFGVPPSLLAQMSAASTPAMEQAVAGGQFGGHGAFTAFKAPATAMLPADVDIKPNPGALVEATATTDGTHVSADAHTSRGSDGDRWVQHTGKDVQGALCICINKMCVSSS